MYHFHLHGEGNGRKSHVIATCFFSSVSKRTVVLVLTTQLVSQSEIRATMALLGRVTKVEGAFAFCRQTASPRPACDLSWIGIKGCNDMYNGIDYEHRLVFLQTFILLFYYSYLK